MLGEVLFDPVQGWQSVHVVLHKSLTSKPLFLCTCILLNTQLRVIIQFCFPRKRWQIYMSLMSGKGVNSNNSILRLNPCVNFENMIKTFKTFECVSF